MFTKIIRWYFKLINKSPTDMEMVSYWKTQKGVQAKVTKAKDGSTHMVMEGEKYPFPTFPRAFILFGPLSKLKHEIKTQIFNETWHRLKNGENRQTIIKDVKKILLEGVKVKDTSALYGRRYTSGEELMEILKYDMLPPNAMSPFSREIYRAWKKISPKTSKLRDTIIFIAQEDDAYRFRIQWLCQWFGWFMKINPVKSFDYALRMMEHAEVISDMKERIRLFRTVLMLALEDQNIRRKFIALFREIKWSKVKLTKGDKYHFRGKYFKVDYKYLEY